MLKPTLRIVRGAINRIRPVIHNTGYDVRSTHAHGEDAADLLRRKVLDGKPLMVTRFGANELRATLTHYYRTLPNAQAQKLRKYLTGILVHLDWDDTLVRDMSNNAGFFPATVANLDRFGARMLADLPLIDILGSWQLAEPELAHLMPQAQRIPLLDLEPYRLAQPWTSALAGKRVVVVHPFNNTIERQYNQHRATLFANPQTLPNFELRTVKAVQSIAGNSTGHKDWFEALAWMENEMERQPYDVALIGCGAYGLPLAATAKRHGRQAIHLGGALQILFGIKGQRWDKFPEINRLYNPHWCRPDAEDIPEGAKGVENGCYW